MIVDQGYRNPCYLPLLTKLLAKETVVFENVATELGITNFLVKLISVTIISNVSTQIQRRTLLNKKCVGQIFLFIKGHKKNFPLEMYKEG